LPPETVELAARVTWAADVEREVVEWLDPKSRFIPKRSITVLAGQPGLGRSMFSVLIAAGLSKEGRRSLIFTAEDSWAITIRPRLEACQANLDLIGYAEIVGTDGLSGAFTFPDDVDRLAELVDEHEFELVVIDPLVGHLTRGINSWHDQSIRTALAPLHRLAEEHDLAILSIGHLNKREDADALTRLGGSVGIPAAARSVLLMSADPDEDEGRGRIVARVKCNVDAPVPSCMFELQPILLPSLNGHPETNTARLVFVRESDHQGEQLLQRMDADDRAARSQAEEFLLGELGDGPRPAKELQTTADSLGIPQKALRRAKDKLKVEAVKHGFGFAGSWYWLLPGQTLHGTVDDEQQLF
jgi:AAA domain-containing protein